MSLTPTLALSRWELGRNHVPVKVIERFERDAVVQLHDFAAAGGDVLFGTDIGYVTEFDTTAELGLMAAAGLDGNAVLAALTTAPSRRFGPSLKNGGRATGEIAPGASADLVVVDGDPLVDVTAFARVRRAVRAGATVYVGPK